MAEHEAKSAHIWPCSIVRLPSFRGCDLKHYPSRPSLSHLQQTLNPGTLKAVVDLHDSLSIFEPPVPSPSAHTHLLHHTFPALGVCTVNIQYPGP